MNTPVTFSERLGVLLSLWLAGSAAAGATVLAIRMPLTPLLPLAVFAVSVFWLRQVSASRRDTFSVAGVALAMIAGALLIGLWQFDLSYDGQTYHQVAVRGLAGGWNPVWNAAAGESMSNGLHVGSLPKAAWIIEAMLYQGTGRIEAAKGIHFVALGAALLLGFGALRRLGVARPAALTVSALAAAGPVTISQLFTFHVDGIMASTLVAVVSLVVLYFQGPGQLSRAPLVLASAFLANLKFPGLVYAALIAVVALTVVALTHRPRLKSSIAVAGVAALIALVEGINPYVTNTIRHGHPAYPAAGPDAVTLAPLVFRNPAFANLSRPEQVARSVFSRSSDDFEALPVMKMPFAVRISELGAFTTVDTRVGGWGPLFGGALILSWMLLLPAVLRREPRARTLAGASALVLLSSLLVPFGYYARYTPHLWLACLPALLIDDLRGWRTRALAGILTANLLLVGGVSIGTRVVDDRLHRAQLRQLARDAAGGVINISQLGPPFVNADLHLDAYGIQHAETATPTCAAPALLLRTHVQLCLPDGRSPAPTPEPLDAVRPLLTAIGADGVLK